MKPVKKTSKPVSIIAKPATPAKPAAITAKPATPAKPVKAAVVKPAVIVKPTVIVKPATIVKAKPAKVAKPSEPATVKTVVAEPTQEAIALRAYLIWEKSGRQNGRDAENWREALAQLKAES